MFLNQQLKAWFTNAKQSTYKKDLKKKSHLNSERQQQITKQNIVKYVHLLY